MITMRIVAGLANQMFQYAYGRALALERNDELFLDIDPFYYDTRDYELGIFNIDEHIATSKQKPRYLKLWKNKLLDQIQYLIILIGKKFNPHHLIENPKYPQIWKGMYDYNPLISSQVLCNKADFYLEGFWHSEKYFEKYKDIIRKDFTLRKPIDDEVNTEAMALMGNCNSVSIHVRRGDYAGTHYENICGMDYYRKAIAYMQDHVTNPRFFVLSDDIDRCKEQFKDYDIQQYMENGGNTKAKNLAFKGTEKHGGDAYKNMILMSRCKHNIMANSTFSWRGARLNPNPDKIVIAPKKRHANLDYADIIPDEWVRM